MDCIGKAPIPQRQTYALCNLDLLHVYTAERILPMDRNDGKVNGIRLLSLGKSALQLSRNV
jgi:hypothetical protein